MPTLSQNGNETPTTFAECSTPMPLLIPEGCHSYEAYIPNFDEAAKDVSNEYKKYSKSCVAGFRSVRAAKQMTGHINTFFVELCEDSFKNFFCIDKLRDIFTERTSSGKWKDSSAATYRNTIKDFFGVLGNYKEDVVPEMVVSFILGALKRWAVGNHTLYKVQMYLKRKETEKNVALT